jgi:hypothetical protein
MGIGITGSGTRNPFHVRDLCVAFCKSLACKGQRRRRRRHQERHRAEVSGTGFPLAPDTRVGVSVSR